MIKTLPDFSLVQTLVDNFNPLYQIPYDTFEYMVPKKYLPDLQYSRMFDHLSDKPYYDDRTQVTFSNIQFLTMGICHYSNGHAIYTDFSKTITENNKAISNSDFYTKRSHDGVIGSISYGTSYKALFENPVLYQSTNTDCWELHTDLTTFGFENDNPRPESVGLRDAVFGYENGQYWLSYSDLFVLMILPHVFLDIIKYNDRFYHDIKQNVDIFGEKYFLDSQDELDYLSQDLHLY